MQLRLALSFALLTFISLSAFGQYQQPPYPQPQHQWGKPKPPKTGACFYKDSNFRGEYFCLKLGESWSSMPSGFNDKITAIRLFNGAQVRIFVDNDFRGANSRIPRDVSDLHNIRVPNSSKNWNDRISSMAVYRANDSWDRGHP